MAIFDFIFKFIVMWRYCRDCSMISCCSNMFAILFGSWGIAFFAIIGSIYFSSDSFTDDDDMFDDKYTLDQKKMVLNRRARETLTSFLLSVFLTTIFTELVVIYLKFIEFNIEMSSIWCCCCFKWCNCCTCYFGKWQREREHYNSIDKNNKKSKGFELSSAIEMVVGSSA